MTKKWVFIVNPTAGTVLPGSMLKKSRKWLKNIM
jgi:hypothetical protein